MKLDGKELLGRYVHALLEKFYCFAVDTMIDDAVCPHALGHGDVIRILVYFTDLFLYSSTSSQKYSFGLDQLNRFKKATKLLKVTNACC